MLNKKRNVEEKLAEHEAMLQAMREAEEAQRRMQEAIKRFLFTNYEPSESLQEGITMTTTEIFERLQEHYPSRDYTPADVASWMQHEGFRTANKGDLKLEWMMKKRA